MTQINKPAVKQDLDRYVDIVDLAMKALELLKQAVDLQEQIDEGYGAEEDETQLATINNALSSLRSLWAARIQSCGLTNNRGSLEVPLSGLTNLDANNGEALEQEIRAAKAEIKAQESLYEIEAKSFKQDE